MIIDKIDNIKTYQCMFPEVVRFLEHTDINTIGVGKHEISKQCFALVNEYKTIKSDKFIAENHRQYIDFQLIVQGVETIAIAQIENLQLHKEYDNENDYELYIGEGSKVVLKQNQFAVFFPAEAHQPMLSTENETNVRKIVFKIKAQYELS